MTHTALTPQQEANIKETCLLSNCIDLIIKMAKESNTPISQICETLSFMAERRNKKELSH